MRRRGKGAAGSGRSAWLLLAALACRPQAWRSALPAPSGAPPELVAACELAGARCSRCHPVERVALAHVDRPEHWAWYVTRMRRQPQSNISEPEGETITRCLVARSFGLAATTPPSTAAAPPANPSPPVNPPLPANPPSPITPAQTPGGSPP